MEIENEPEHVNEWITNKPFDFDEEFIKYRPKIIREYKENGVTVTVYEARHV